MSDVIAAEQLRLLIERAERIEEEIKAMRQDKAAVFAEAKSVGFDTKTMKEIIKLRAMEPDARREREALIDTYKAALGMLDGTPLGRWAMERLKPKPPEKTEPEGDQPDDGDGGTATGGDRDESEAPIVPPSPAEPATPAEPAKTVDDARQMGRDAGLSGQPVTANPFPPYDERRAAWDEAWCAALGSDGMDIPEALRPKPKQPKKGDEA
ncbi:hypothetical protein BH10PSE14_BH10PSE14_06440 [soil metagenome]